MLNPSKQEAARVKGLGDIASILSQCSIRESLYRHSYESEDNHVRRDTFSVSHTGYRDALKALYVKILTFQVTSVCFFYKHTPGRLAADMVKWDPWDKMLEDIKA